MEYIVFGVIFLAVTIAVIAFRKRDTTPTSGPGARIDPRNNTRDR